MIITKQNDEWIKTHRPMVENNLKNIMDILKTSDSPTSDDKWRDEL